MIFAGLGFSFFAGGVVKTDEADAYAPDAGLTTKAQAKAWGEIVTENVAKEGMVLLKNGLVNGQPALPLTAGSKVSLFGKNTKKPVLGGSGSSGGSGGSDANTIPSALTAAGFSVNPTLVSFYGNDSLSGSCRNFGVSGGATATYYGLPVDETPASSYRQTERSSFDEYNHAALIMISRVGGEAFDLPRTSYNQELSGGAVSGIMRGRTFATEHYLQLDANEKDLIRMVKAAGFKKTVLLLNVGTSFELGFVDTVELGVDAVLHVGFPGGTGMNALGGILSGAVNPSGKTVDIFSKDFKKDPSWQNFGNNLVVNGNRYRTSSGTFESASAVAYREGIYVGYRYYETRAYTDPSFIYQDEVQYPFGYGLSYTNFSWTVSELSVEALTRGLISVDVKVKNVGTRAGKDVVQLYFSPPAGRIGIEKSHVVLAAFGKTDLLAPGQEQVLRLSFPVCQMESWDMVEGLYVLEAGDYRIFAGRDSHAWADSSTKQLTYRVASDTINATSPSTGYRYQNRFRETLGTESNTQYNKAVFSAGTVFSRKDWAGTWPKTYGGASNTADLTVTSAWISSIAPSTALADTGMPWYSAATPKTGTTPSGGAIMLGDMYGLDKNDQKWETFLDQMTEAQMAGLTRGGFSMGTIVGGLDALGFFSSEVPDGTSGFVGHSSMGLNGDLSNPGACFYASHYLLACTYNQELAQEMGNAIGNEALLNGFAGIYAPRMNLHRSPFCGRNFESFSEDGLLSGKIGAAMIRGIQGKGCVAFMKNFFLNEQETNRDSPSALITWANEQTIRELYAEAFRYAVEEGGALGVMTAFNRIGTTWAGAHYGALNQVLRGEWGFKGATVSDWDQDYMNSNNMIRCGGDMRLSNTGAVTALSPTHLTALRKSAHNIAYMTAHSLSSIGYQGVDGLNVNLVKGNPVYVSLKPTRIVYRTGASAAVSFTAEVNGTLPAGLSFNAATGVLSGVAPTSIGEVKIRITAYEGAKRMATNEFSLRVVDAQISKFPIGVTPGDWTGGDGDDDDWMDDLYIAMVKLALENSAFRAEQADVATAAQARTAVGESVTELLDFIEMNAVVATVTDGAFTAAVAGTAQNPLGTNGSYTFTVTLNKGTGTPQTTKQMTLTVFATPFEPGGAEEGTPSAPQNLTATPGNAQVTLAWSAPSDAGGSAITEYQCSCDGGATWVNASGALSHVFYGLTIGTEYTLKVRAVNAVGFGAAATVTATPVASVVPDTTVQDNAAIAAARLLVEAAPYFAAQKDVTTAIEAKAAVEAIIAALPLNGVTASVSGGAFTAATAGTRGNTKGANGVYAFTVTLSYGMGASVATAPLTLTIIASEYEPQSQRDRSPGCAGGCGTVGGGDFFGGLLAGAGLLMVFGGLFLRTSVQDKKKTQKKR